MKSLLPRLLHLGVRLSLGLLLLAGLCLALGMQALPAHAQSPSTFTVNDCSSDSQLQNDVTQANTDNDGDTINFSCSGDITLTQRLSISGSMTIDGSGQNVVLDGQNQFEVFFVGLGPLTFHLSSITVANGLYPDGGGLSNFGGTVSINNSTFQNNSACDNGDDFGGAIYSSGHTTISNSTFVGNSAALGGAIYSASGGPVSISNSTFSGNSADACNTGGGSGGAIADATTTTSISSSTIAGNSAPPGNGGGLAYEGGGGSIQSVGSIVANNTGGNCASSLGNVIDQGYNLESASDCSFTNTGSLQNIDPQLVALANNGGPTKTMALGASSPAIDQVPLASCPSTDQRGMTRPDASYESSCDMGAYESNYAPTDTDLGLTNMPADITTPATSSSGAVVHYTLPTVVDEDSQLPPVNCSPASGSTFPVGPTTVTCTVTDSDDTPSTVSQTFNVTVTDTDLGLSHVPANITTKATNPSGAVVNYHSPNTVDEDSPLPPVNCSPASGSTFAIGQTTVNCSVSDSDDTPSTVSQSFTVTVNPVLTLSVPTTTKATEGASANRTVATGKAYGTVNPLTATINWGDSSSPTVLNITPASDGSYSVASPHTYAEEGQYTLTVTIQDGGSLSAQKSSAVSVADAALKLRSISTSTSGKTLTLKGSFSDGDPGAALGDYTATISWGDGSANSPATLSSTISATIFNYLGKHSYAAHGTYTVTITITDAGGSSITATTAVTV